MRNLSHARLMAAAILFFPFAWMLTAGIKNLVDPAGKRSAQMTDVLTKGFGLTEQWAAILARPARCTFAIAELTIAAVCAYGLLRPRHMMWCLSLSTAMLIVLFTCLMVGVFLSGASYPAGPMWLQFPALMAVVVTLCGVCYVLDTISRNTVVIHPAILRSAA